MDRLPADLFLTALFRAAGLAVLVFALAPLAGVDLSRDALLLAALAVVATLSILARALLRRDAVEYRAGVVALLLTGIAVGVTVCIQRTGGLSSPLIVVLGGVALAGALLLPPLLHFVTLSAICLAQTFMVVAAADGTWPARGPRVPEPFALLVVELGLMVLAASAVSTLVSQQQRMPAAPVPLPIDAPGRGSEAPRA